MRQSERMRGLLAGDRSFRVLTALTVISVWVLVAVGGIVRVTGSGLGCPDWPLCTPSLLPLANTESVIEYSHRVVVAWVTVLVLAVAVQAWRTQRHHRGVLWAASIAVLLLPAQAVLGAIAIDSDLTGTIVAYHFLLGMLFLATNAATAAAAWRPRVPHATSGFAGLAAAGALTALGTVVLGAAVAANGAAMACGEDWPLCNGGFATGSPLAALQVTHRMFAYTVAGIAVGLAILAARGHGPRLLGIAPLVVVLIQIGLGVGIVTAGVNFTVYAAFSGAHVAGAGLVWGVLVVLAFASRVAPTPAAAPAEPGRSPVGGDDRRVAAATPPNG